ncbi:MAG TPA: hypothetical protein VJP07_01550 [Dehalococcoidia bacterium]|nr:hypothetical protein [Dehalococcoidia bacterium]
MRALNQPESWWGWHGYNQPQALSITQIMRAGTFPPRIGAILWLAMECGRSLILAADPPGAGKTTILTAMLAFAKPEASVYFTQGWGETFPLPAQTPEDPPLYILINEMSDHLPVYSWGPYVRKTFELAADGYSFASTMHADTVDGVIEQLRDECDVPETLLGHLAFVVPMFVGHRDGARVRRVSEIAVLEPLGTSYDRHSIACWQREGDGYDVLSTPAQINAAARRLGMEDDEFLDELGRRERFLEELLRDNVLSMDDVQLRVLRFSGYDAVEE